MVVCLLFGFGFVVLNMVDCFGSTLVIDVFWVAICAVLI